MDIEAEQSDAKQSETYTGVLGGYASSDGYLRPSSAESEITIREVVMQSIQCGCSAKEVVVSLMALSRTLGTMANITAQNCKDREVCFQAANTVAVASNCEQMVRSLTGLRFIETYSFIGDDDSDEAE